MSSPTSPLTSQASQLILVVEDNPDNRYLITAILEESDYKYITAENGEEAVTKAKESLPGLILMDIQLPEMNGFEATKQIRKIYPNLPIVAQTAYAMPEDRVKSFEAGCNDFIVKPINKELLLNIIDYLI